MEIDKYRHFRSTSGKTSDKKITQINFIAPNDASWNFRGSPCEQFFNTMNTSQDMDLFGKKLPQKNAIVNWSFIFETKSQFVLSTKTIWTGKDEEENFWFCVDSNSKTTQNIQISMLLKVRERVQPFHQCPTGIDN